MSILNRFGPLVAAALLLSGCASQPAPASHTASAKARPLPATYARIGVPKTVKEAHGATATITLTAVHYAPAINGEPSGLETLCAFRITGTSTKPFEYGEDAVYYEPGTLRELEDHFFDDSHLYGPDLSVDYTPYAKWGKPLGIGVVKKGQTVTGLVDPANMGTDTAYVLTFDDASKNKTASDEGLHPLAQWVLHSPKRA